MLNWTVTATVCAVIMKRDTIAGSSMSTLRDAFKIPQDKRRKANAANTPRKMLFGE